MAGMHAALPIVVVIVSAVVYHLAQKSAGSATSPWPLLALAYGAAFVITVALALATSDDALRMPTRSERAAAVLIGVAALGIEAGFFFTYRAGWPLASASVVGNVSTTIVLALIGVIALGEHLTTGRAAGIAFAAAGAWLIVRR